MKLLLENWRRYTTSLINEDLIIESLEQAENSVLNRATKLIKGWVYSHDKESYDFIEQKTQEAMVKFNPPFEIAFGWKIGGYFILTVLKNRLVPEDIEDNQKKVALMWVYRQLVDEKIVSLNDLLEGIFNNIKRLYNQKVYFMSATELTTILPVLTSFGRFLHSLYVPMFEYGDTTNMNRTEISRRKLVENFFQWNRFIRDGKRDLNAVADYDELFELVEEAKPLYQAWQDKQDQADAEQGKEVLLDDENWQIIAIHNKCAACH